MIPTIHNSDRKVVTAGTDTMVILTGAAFRNIGDGIPFESEVSLTADDGSSVTLTPDVVVDDGILVTIPGDTAPGNYAVQAVKAGAASNPAVISVIPEVIVTDATANGTVTIKGSGFGGYAQGSGTSVTMARSWGWGRWARTTAVEAKIVSWSDTEIVADFGSSPTEVTVTSVFGRATASVKSSRRSRVRGPSARSSTSVFGSATANATSSTPDGETDTQPPAPRKSGWRWWW
jgi:hypothetical protein